LDALKLYLQKWRWYERNSLPWNRLAIHRELARRNAFVRWPVQGNVLESFREGRLEIGEHTLLEPHVWLTTGDSGRIRIGRGTFLNVASPSTRVIARSPLATWFRSRHRRASTWPIT